MEPIIISLPSEFYRPLLEQKVNIIGLPLTAQLIQSEGDIIIFYEIDTEDQFEAQIIDVRSYYAKYSLTTLLIDQGIRNVSPCMRSLDSVIQIYSKHWDIDKLQRDGVVALKLRRI